MFLDIHSHILPGVDDGPTGVAKSEQLLRELTLGGVTHIAFTPHFYPDQKTIEAFLEKRNRAYQKLVLVSEMEKIKFTLGAEVYLTDTLFNNTDLSRLCYEGTNFMLVEPEYTDSLTKATRTRILRLIEEYGIVPVLAHIDRYPFLWKDLKNLAHLREMGCLFQVNLSSFTDLFSRYRALKLADEGLIHFLGEDIHSSVMSPSERNKKLAFWEKKRPGFLEKIAKKTEKALFSNEK